MRRDDPVRGNPDVTHERSDVNAFAVTATGIGVLLGTLATVFVLWFYFEHLTSSGPQVTARPELAPKDKSVREPLLQPAPTRDLADLRHSEDAVLNGAAPAAMPIERAMDALAERGLPPTGDYSDLHLTTPRAGSRQTGFETREAGQP
jgi:hypothetical protein